MPNAMHLCDALSEIVNLIVIEVTQRCITGLICFVSFSRDSIPGTMSQTLLRELCSLSDPTAWFTQYILGGP
jgi:hypothetical protein